MVCFAVHIHAVDHRPDVVLQADAILRHRAKLAVKIIHQHPALPHVQIDSLAPDRLGLAVIHRHLLQVVVVLGAVFHGIRLLWLWNPYIHRLRLDRFDQALRHQRRNIRLVGELQRRVLHRLQQWSQSLHRARPRVDQRLHSEVEIRMPDQIHRHRSRRIGSRRDHYH